MKKVAEFSINESFSVTGRGLVILGTLTSGEINEGDFIYFNDGIEDRSLKISAINFARKGDSMEYIGLLFDYEDDVEKISFMNLKLLPQIAIIARR